MISRISKKQLKGIKGKVSQLEDHQDAYTR